MNEPQLGDLEPFIKTLESFKRIDLAIEVLEEFAKYAFNYEQLDNIAKCYFKLKYYNQAIKYSEKTLAVAGNSQQIYFARFNLINVYNHANYPEKALRYIKMNQAVIPNDINITLENAYSHFLINKKKEAESILNEALLTPNLSEELITKIKFNLGTYHLYRDEFQTGLRLFLEEGAKMKFWNTDTIFTRNINLNFETFERKVKAQKFIKWDGKPKPGKKLIIHAEAGIGDEIINFRFLKYIKDQRMDPYWYNSSQERKDLLSMFKRHGYNTIQSLREVDSDTEIYYVQSMHLPIVMGLEYPDLWYGSYLKPDSFYIKKWRHIKQNKPVIGIRWQGNPAYDQDLHRSVPLKQILDCFEGYDVKLVSLQKDNGLEEIDDRILDLSDQLNSWEDTLGLMSNLDLVITSCTSVAHASGAAGFPTVVMVPISAYYVWSHSMEQSPWYGNHVTLCRQEKPRVWDEPIKKLLQIIKQRFSHEAR
ncbi:hypothetical protein EBZ38_12245 [bacterium]|nr:hypothetical protein [bacterium]